MVGRAVATIVWSRAASRTERSSPVKARVRPRFAPVSPAGSPGPCGPFGVPAVRAVRAVRAVAVLPEVSALPEAAAPPETTPLRETAAFPETTPLPGDTPAWTTDPLASTCSSSGVLRCRGVLAGAVRQETAAAPERSCPAAAAGSGCSGGRRSADPRGAGAAWAGAGRRVARWPGNLTLLLGTGAARCTPDTRLAISFLPPCPAVRAPRLKAESPG